MAGTTRRGFLTGAGAAVAASTGTASGQTADGNESDGADGGGTTHTVEMNDQLQFVPASITIAPGDTIVWENVGTIGHSTTAYEDEIPEEADFFASGGFDEEQRARNVYPEGEVAGGETYSHTFPVEGSYGYFCIPHEGAGMIASLSVVPGGGGGGEGEGEGAASILPDAARTIAIVTVAGLVSILGLAYFFMKYGGDYEGGGRADGGD
jgi:plastocyanin